MKRVLGLVHGEFISHVVPVLAVARALRAAGEYEVLFAGNGPYMRLVTAAGFAWVEAETVTQAEIYQALAASFVPAIFSPARAAHLLAVESALLAEHRPHILVRDLFRELAGVAAKLPHLRTFDVFLQRAPLSPYYHFDFVPDDAPALLRHAPPGLLAPLWPFGEWLYRRKASAALRRQARRVGIARRHLRADGVRPDLALFPDSPEIFPVGWTMPEAGHIGPLLVAGGEPAPPWLDEFLRDPRRKVVWSVGTTGVHEHLLAHLESLADGAYAVAVYANRGVPNGVAAGAAAGVASSIWGGHPFDLDLVLPAADVFVTHGGVGSCYRGLRHGVPMLVLYDHIEQQTFARALAVRGLGASIPKAARSPAAVRRQIDALAAGSAFRQRIAALGLEIDGVRSAALALRRIEEGYRRFAAEQGLAGAG